VTGSPVRSCAGCGARLSRYNPGGACSACLAAEAAAARVDGDGVCPACGRGVAEGIVAAGNDIGQRIGELRLQRRLTQRELADKAGVSFSLVSKLESGHRKSAGYECLAALAGALGVQVGVLLSAPASERQPGGRGKHRVSGSWRWR
jgi:DNA-binding Xre family transcriptional regulator